ncbi:putative lipoprotein, partial [Chrysochromulina tobinii]
NLILANVATHPGIRIDTCSSGGSAAPSIVSVLPANASASLDTYLFFSSNNIIESPTAGFQIVSPCTGTAPNFTNTDPLIFGGTFTETSMVPIDPRPACGSAAYSNVDPVPNGDAFFSPTTYKGAFGSVNWLDGWSFFNLPNRPGFVSSTFTCPSAADRDDSVALCGTLSADRMLYSGALYVLTCQMFVPSGITLGHSGGRDHLRLAGGCRWRRCASPDHREGRLSARKGLCDYADHLHCLQPHRVVVVVGGDGRVYRRAYRARDERQVGWAHPARQRADQRGDHRDHRGHHRENVWWHQPDRVVGLPAVRARVARRRGRGRGQRDQRHHLRRRGLRHRRRPLRGGLQRRRRLRVLRRHGERQVPVGALRGGRRLRHGPGLHWQGPVPVRHGGPEWRPLDGDRLGPRLESGRDPALAPGLLLVHLDRRRHRHWRAHGRADPRQRRHGWQVRQRHPRFPELERPPLRGLRLDAELHADAAGGVGQHFEPRLLLLLGQQHHRHGDDCVAVRSARRWLRRRGLHSRGHVDGAVNATTDLAEGSATFNPLPSATGAACTGTVDAPPNGDAFFSSVTCKGAFGSSTDNWLAGYSLLACTSKMAGSTCSGVPASNFAPLGSSVVAIGGTLTSSLALVSGTSYLLTSQLFVSSGFALNIFAGTTVYALPAASPTSAPAIVVLKGGYIVASGSATMPITFTTVLAEAALVSSATATTDSNYNAITLGERGKWGGLILLGNAPTNMPTTTEIEG